MNISTALANVDVVAALSFALGRAGEQPSVTDAVKILLTEIDRRGLMIVSQDYAKEALEPGYFYDPDNWETTYTDRSQAIEDLQEGDKLEIGSVAKLGRLVELPPVFLVRIPIDDGGYEIEEFDNRAKAEEMAQHIATPRSMLKLEVIQPGDRLVAEDGFTCLTENTIVTVLADPEREGAAGLYVPCADGRHYLDGQEDEDGICIGFARAERQAPKAEATP